MNIEVLGTGSSGNCYKVSDGESTLLLECGLPYKIIQKKLRFKMHSLDACLVTHEHMDHAKACKDMLKNGIDLYMTYGTSKALDLKGHRLHNFRGVKKDELVSYKAEKIKTFKVLAFETIHDADEPVGFYIKSVKNGESLVFITDTAYMKYKIPDCDYLMVECNYVKDRLDYNFKQGLINISLRNRIVKNHLSLETLLEALDMNRLSKLKKIYVLHLSDGNSDEKVIEESLKAKTGVLVYIC
ncbi:MBL fold metallo-hydrolase [Anaerococcus sp. AGMB00486]|uniref:MBL fold metallo-hydrolase n=2 Tax=Anaerococcus TaxID=165779 RepID=A0ABX2N7X5_9FIRM|nr:MULTISPECIES: MBL fold metallo-hydrolase [Anaerococcus]MSS77402.1 MBL fold metallo-hydrolase [Anaerococcus porci]NVF10796.1 MBL fold metallo-hydrolase [Anaerococcus faecalis]